ncbi:putative allantoinase 1 [Hypsizygus marmoreus]|uniref:Allantoinase 1 n=1 Tax=Hypsizygus marmoreus TaxID=39966 RepID=A0A369JVC0_HYPMA|nr:putative allantoinase 1 [Hypsizygus marmoreus]
MSGLPTLPDILSGTSSPDSALAHSLSILFESSPVLITTLEPQLAQSLSNASSVTSYSELIDTALEAIASWDVSSQSGFIAGHPRIGETKNLSSLSAKEQGGIHPGIAPTPPEVLARLAHLNACYEAKYPGLRYITFVNGRTRRAIAEEMEDVLGFEHSLSPNEPGVSSLMPVEVNGEEWIAELQRAIQDIGRIAKSRLKVFGVE